MRSTTIPFRWTRLDRRTLGSGGISVSGRSDSWHCDNVFSLYEHFSNLLRTLGGIDTPSNGMQLAACEDKECETRVEWCWEASTERQLPFFIAEWLVDYFGESLPIRTMMHWVCCVVLWRSGVADRCVSRNGLVFVASKNGKTVQMEVRDRWQVIRAWWFYMLLIGSIETMFSNVISSVEIDFFRAYIHREWNVGLKTHEPNLWWW